MGGELGAGREGGAVGRGGQQRPGCHCMNRQAIGGPLCGSVSQGVVEGSVPASIFRVWTDCSRPWESFNVSGFVAGSTVMGQVFRLRNAIIGLCLRLSIVIFCKFYTYDSNIVDKV